MQYQLDYTVYRFYESCPSVREFERGSVEFSDVHTAQKFCESPEHMLDYFDAECGEFTMRGGERPYGWEWLWQMSYDVTDEFNRLPIAYRMWRDAIHNVSA